MGPVSIWWYRLIQDWCVILICITLAPYVSYWFWLPLAWVIGTRQHALGIIGHMAAHKYCGKNSKELCYISMMPIGIDPIKYKTFHFAHHRHLGSAIHDPEVNIVNRFKSRWVKFRWGDVALSAFGLHVDESLYVLSKMGKIRSLVTYTLTGVILSLVFGYAGLLWFVASITGLTASHRLRAWTEHNHITHPGVTFVTSKPPFYKRWYLPHNTWRHFEHHANVKGI